MLTTSDDPMLLELFLTPIRKCAKYRPVFGQGKATGLSLAQFDRLYGSDPFYAWLGLNHPAVYAAHRAAGGMTSLYRQIGVGAERLVRTIIADNLSLTTEQIAWNYQYAKSQSNMGVHTLDARVNTDDLAEPHRSRLVDLLGDAQRFVVQGHDGGVAVHGLVMEIRQGYKSADSKRQNADLRYGIAAWRSGLLPVVLVLSGQVSEVVVRRYQMDGMLVLRGTLDKDPLTSTFEFIRRLTGYDLDGFFARNAGALQAEMSSLVTTLLSS